jgi:hypothetical protein
MPEIHLLRDSAHMRSFPFEFFSQVFIQLGIIVFKVLKKNGPLVSRSSKEDKGPIQIQGMATPPLPTSTPTLI